MCCTAVYPRAIAAVAPLCGLRGAVESQVAAEEQIQVALSRASGGVLAE